MKVVKRIDQNIFNSFRKNYDKGKQICNKKLKKIKKK